MIASPHDLLPDGPRRFARIRDDHPILAHFERYEFIIPGAKVVDYFAEQPVDVPEAEVVTAPPAPVASRPMRILTVSAHYPPNFVSGGTLQPQGIARGLAARGHESHVFAGWLGDHAGRLHLLNLAAAAVMAIAIVDNAGMLVAFERMDNTQFGSIAVSQDKAVSAALYRRTTKVFQDALAAGGAGGASFFMRLTCLTIMKMMKARIRKLMRMVMKLP